MPDLLAGIEKIWLTDEPNCAQISLPHDFNACFFTFSSSTPVTATPPPPSAEEARLIRTKAASDILSLVPRPVARTFFAVKSGSGAANANDDEENRKSMMRAEIEESILCWTDDVELNKYLVYSILDHVLLRLVPEMQGKTPIELLAERGVVLTNSEADADADAEELLVDLNGEKGSS
ncbi:hypothetical protein LTR67_006973 [Exophiala xenobiotica]